MEDCIYTEITKCNNFIIFVAFVYLSMGAFLSLVVRVLQCVGPCNERDISSCYEQAQRLTLSCLWTAATSELRSDSYSFRGTLPYGKRHAHVLFHSAFELRNRKRPFILFQSEHPGAHRCEATAAEQRLLHRGSSVLPEISSARWPEPFRPLQHRTKWRQSYPAGDGSHHYSSISGESCPRTGPDRQYVRGPSRHQHREQCWNGRPDSWYACQMVNMAFFYMKVSQS